MPSSKTSTSKANQFQDERKSLHCIGRGKYDSVFYYPLRPEEVVLYTRNYWKLQVYQACGLLYEVSHGYTYHDKRRTRVYRAVVKYLEPVGDPDDCYTPDLLSAYENKIKLINSERNKFDRVRARYLNKGLPYKHVLRETFEYVKRHPARFPIYHKAADVAIRYLKNSGDNISHDDHLGNYMVDPDSEEIIPTDCFNFEDW
jgi:hypothetical protein